MKPIRRSSLGHESVTWPPSKNPDNPSTRVAICELAQLAGEQSENYAISYSASGVPLAPSPENNRQILLAFDTGAIVPIGSGPYEIMEAEVSISFANDLVVAYDPTSDPWQMFLPAGDARRVNDPDAGQPIELAGVGFRGGFTAATFQENSAYAVSGASYLSPGVRNAFAACYDSANNFVDMSNHPRVGFQPNVFAVGQVAGLAAGQLIPQDSVMTFQVNVADANIQNYLRQVYHCPLR